MKDTVEFKEVFDQHDDMQMRELIVRVATRIHHFAKGRMAEQLANPMALQMLIGYLNGALINACQTYGVDLTMAPSVTGIGYDIHMDLKLRN